MSGRRAKKLRRSFATLQDHARTIGESRYRSFKRAWTRRTMFVFPGGAAFLRGKP